MLTIGQPVRFLSNYGIKSGTIIDIRADGAYTVYKVKSTDGSSDRYFSVSKDTKLSERVLFSEDENPQICIKEKGFTIRIPRA